MPLLCRVPWAPRNGTVVIPAPNYNGILQWHHVHSQSWSSPSPPTIAHYNGTLQWHHVHSPKVGRPALQPYNGTQQWHHVHSQSWPSPSSPHYNGTLQWHPAMAPRPLPRSWSSPSRNHSTLQWHPTMGPSNRTTSTAPCNNSRCHVQSAKMVRRHPPLLEVRTPIAIALWGKMNSLRLELYVDLWTRPWEFQARYSYGVTWMVLEHSTIPSYFWDRHQASPRTYHEVPSLMWRWCFFLQCPRWKTTISVLSSSPSSRTAMSLTRYLTSEQ